jgi:hypothetical protein
VIARNIPQQKNYHEGYLVKIEDEADIARKTETPKTQSGCKTLHMRYFFVLEVG